LPAKPRATRSGRSRIFRPRAWLQDNPSWLMNSCANCRMRWIA
jgi:hypothetical protein